MQYPRKGDVPPGYGGEGGGGGMTLMKAGVVSLVIALIVVFGMNMLGFLGVASSTYNDFVDYAQTNYALKTEIPAAVQGPQGAQGVQGAQGIQGTQGVGIASAAIDSDGHLVLTLTDGSTIDAGAVTAGTSETTAESIVTCELGPVGSMSKTYDAVNDVTILTMGILATVKNTGSQNLGKLEFSIVCSLYNTSSPFTLAFITSDAEDGTVDGVASYASIVGDKIAAWYVEPYGTSPYAPVFTNYITSGWGAGYTLDAGEEENIHLTLTLRYKTNVTAGLVLDEPVMECTDYKLAD